MRRLVVLGLALAACGDKEPLAARIEVVSVEPTFVPPDVAEIGILFRTTQRGAVRVSLETGAADVFLPARELYRAHGFVECAPFGDYTADRHSVFLALAL